MPVVDAVRATGITRTPRVIQVEGLFDVPPSERSEQKWHVELPIEGRDWNIGLIVGPSGAGKTTVAKTLWPDAMFRQFEWPSDGAMIDGFPNIGIHEIADLLTGVGFGSIPLWLHPFSTLSTGEQFRVTMARTLAEQRALVVIDEFTSVVDRQVAKVSCHALQKTIRRRNSKFVAVTCHYDVVDWLQPDWIYQPHANDFTWRSLQRRPSLEFSICEVSREAWTLFRQYHYLDTKLMPKAWCYGGFINGECVAFDSVMPWMHPSRKNIIMGHRLVVHPDWQGLGLGSRMDDWLGQHLFERGLCYHNVLAHPGMIAYFMRSPRWQRSSAFPRYLSSGNKHRGGLRDAALKTRRLNTVSFIYVPPVKQEKAALRTPAQSQSGKG